MITLDKVLVSLRPGAEWSMLGDSYEGITWLDKVQTKPTHEEVEFELKRLTDKFNASKYQRQRAPEYPPIGDQLDALFHAGVFPPEMTAQIQAVKDKYPKDS